jgi:site-specific recombinase XerD
MTMHPTPTAMPTDDEHWNDAARSAAAFVAGFRSPDTRKSYRRYLACWLEFCAANQLHPYRDIRRTHIEVYLCQLEQHAPGLADSTMRRRISTLSSWFAWLEDEEINVGNPAARVRRPRRHMRPQPWLDRNELTDLLTASETMAATPTRSSACSASMVSGSRRHATPTLPTSPVTAISPPFGSLARVTSPPRSR